MIAWAAALGLVLPLAAQAAPRGQRPPRPLPQTAPVSSGARLSPALSGAASLGGTLDGVGRPGSDCRPRRDTLTYHGGDLVLQPQIFIIFWGQAWQNDSEHLSAAAAVTGMMQQIGGSGFACAWSEYGVPGVALNGGTYLGSEIITDGLTSPLSDDTIRGQIEAEVKAGRAPARSDNLVYIVMPPRGVPVDDRGVTGCGGTNFVFCAYHDSFLGTKVPGRFRYAVLPFPCSSGFGTCFVDPSDNAGLSLQVSGSHELSELVTDPDAPPVGNGGWFSEVTGNENADICAADPCIGSFDAGPQTYFVNSTWSNLAHGCVSTVPCSPPSPIQCTGSAPGECVASTGRASHCAFEWLVFPDIAAGSGGQPSRKISCADGQPFCDADGVADGQCTFQVAACLNSNDPRQACSGSQIGSIRLVRPSLTSVKPMDSSNATALLNALNVIDPNSSGTIAGNVVSYTPDAASTDACSGLVDVVVPLNRNGTARGSRQISASVHTAAGTAGDRITLTCLPAVQ